MRNMARDPIPEVDGHYAPHSSCRAIKHDGYGDDDDPLSVSEAEDRHNGTGSHQLSYEDSEQARDIRHPSPNPDPLPLPVPRTEIIEGHVPPLSPHFRRYEKASQD